MKRIVENKGLKAMTLPELLVVMLVSGILFLALFDGWTVVNRSVGLLRKRWENGSAVYASCCQLEALLQSADTIGKTDDRLLLFRQDGRRMELKYGQGVLEVEDASSGIERSAPDTLFRQVEKVVTIGNTGIPGRIDSLYVVLRVNGRNLRLKFGRKRFFNEEWVGRFREIEEKQSDKTDIQ